MTQNDSNSSFSDQFVRQFGAGVSPESIATDVFRRDQRRARFYAACSLLFWLVGTAGMLLMVIGLNRLVIFLRIAHFDRSGGDWSDHDERMLLWGTDFIHHTLPYAGGGVIALLLAALFTVLYVSSSRQATLTRINISLMQMSDELRRIRREA